MWWFAVLSTRSLKNFSPIANKEGIFETRKPALNFFVKLPPISHEEVYVGLFRRKVYVVIAGKFDKYEDVVVF